MASRSFGKFTVFRCLATARSCSSSAGVAPRISYAMRARVYHGGTLGVVRHLLPLFFAAIVVIGPACKRSSSSRPTVVVSIFPIYDLTRQVAGADADVKLLLPAGRSEHTFDPTPREVEDVAKSRLGVLIGLGLDPWMEKLMKGAAPSARYLRAGDVVKTMPIALDPIADEEAHAGGKKDDDDHDEKGALDPHVWLDPQNAIAITKAIGAELAVVDAAHAAAYRERAEKLAAQLDALDKETEARIKTWKTRGFVTFHGSFTYFAKRYGLEILGVIEPFPGSTPTGAYIQKVLGVVRDKKIAAIFSEPQLDPRPAQIIATEAKIPLGTLDPVGGGPSTGDYAAMIRFNVEALEKVLK